MLTFDIYFTQNKVCTLYYMLNSKTKRFKVFQRLFNFSYKIFPWNHFTVSCRQIHFLELALLCWAFLKYSRFLPLVRLLIVNLATKIQRSLWFQLCAIHEWCSLWIYILQKISKDFLKPVQRYSSSTSIQNGLIHFGCLQ